MKKHLLVLPVLGVLALGSFSAIALNNQKVVSVSAEDAATVMDPGLTDAVEYNGFYAHVYYTTNPFDVDGYDFAYLKINNIQTWEEHAGLEASKFFNVHLQEQNSPWTFEWYATTGKVYARGVYPAGDSVNIDSTLNVQVGQTKALNVNATGAVTFVSSDDTVATVASDGKVTGVSEGTATITATCGSASDTCLVTVTPAGVISTYSIKNFVEWYGTYFVKVNWNDSEFTLDSGSYNKYDATDGTYTYTGANHKDNWKGGSGFYVGSDIVSHHDSLTYLLITFYDSNDEIVAYAQYGNPPSADTIALQSTAEVKVSRTIELTATTNAESVTWTSSDDTIATVSGNGKTATVTGVAIGEATITATLANSASASCTVTVAANESVKLATPTGVIMNAIGDGGYICAFGPVEHASSFRAQYYNAGTEVLAGSHSIANGGALNPVAANLVAGNSYNVRIVAVGDGVDYTDSDPSVIVTVNNDYKRAGANTYVYHTGESYANYFNNLDMCDSTGATMKVSETLWNEATAMYENVFFAERQNLKNGTTTAATNAIARYTYILGKYSQTDYSYLKDYLNLNVTRPSGSLSLGMFSEETNNSLVIIAICCSLVAAAATATVVLIKKRQFDK